MAKQKLPKTSSTPSGGPEQITKSIQGGIGNITSSENPIQNPYNTGFKKIENAVKGKNAQVSSKTSNPEIKEHNQTQEQIVKEGDETQEKIVKEGDETQKEIKGVKETTKQIEKQNNNDEIKNKKQQNVEDEQNERENEADVKRASSERKEIKNSIENLCDCFKKGIGISKKEDSILSKLMGFIPLLLPLLAPLLPLLGLLAGVGLAGLGLSLFKDLWPKIKDWMMEKLNSIGNETVREGLKGTVGLLTEGTTTPELERIREANVEQAKFASKTTRKLRDTNTQIMETGERLSTSDRAKKLIEPPAEQIDELGVFKDSEQKELALEDAKEILENFKQFLVSNKENVKTPAGKEVVSQYITQYVKDTYPVYEKAMQRSGFDPKEDSPPGYENYAAIFRNISNKLKEKKAYRFKPDVEGVESQSRTVIPEIQNTIQTAATESETNWKSMGIPGLPDIVSNNENGFVGGDSSDKSATVMPRTEQEDVSKTSSSENSNTIIAVVPGGGNAPALPAGITSAATPEGGASRAAADTISDSDILGRAVGKQTHHATFPGSS